MDVPSAGPSISDKPSGKCWKKSDSTNIGSTYLVGGFNHLEKYESQWEGLSHILWKNKKCSKPPTRYCFNSFQRCNRMFAWFQNLQRLKGHGVSKQTWRIRQSSVKAQSKQRLFTTCSSITCKCKCGAQ